MTHQLAKERQMQYDVNHYQRKFTSVIKNTSETNPDFVKLSPQLDIPKINKTLKRLHFLRPRERVLIKNYLLCNGKLITAAKHAGIGYAVARQLIRKPRLRKTLRIVYSMLGIGYIDIVNVLKRVIYRQGDFHYDFNRMRAIDMYLRMIGAYAPQKLTVDGQTMSTNKTEVKLVLQKLLKMIQTSEGDSKEGNLNVSKAGLQEVSRSSVEKSETPGR